MIYSNSLDLKFAKVGLSFVMLASLVSCSSKPKNVETAQPTATPAIEAQKPEQNTQSVVQNVAATPAATPSPAVAKVSENAMSKLTDAIKSKNEEQIYTSATLVLQSSPNDEKALNALAIYHYQKGRTATAKYLLNKAIASGGASSALHNNLAMILNQEGELRAAVKEYRKALEISPKDGISAANLGSIYIKMKDYTKARFALEIAVNAGFKDTKTLNNYAISLSADGKLDQAKSIYQSLLKDNSNNREVLLNYAILLIDNMKLNQEGLEVINRLKFIGAPAESRSRLSALENKAKAGLQ